MARNRETKIELTAYDDLFQTDESRAEAALSKIRDIPLSEIDEFPDHPFKVLMDEDMEQLVESIKRNGVMTPATVRLKDDGRYELISGHRRKKACELAGLETLKCEVKDLTRDEAIIVMVESNLQRSVILPSEKAFAYKMRLEAMKRQAGRPTKDNYSPLGNNSDFATSSDELAEKVGESKNQIFRFIRLTELVPEILQMVDEKQIAFRPAVEISYLAEEQQYTLLEAMSYNDATPSLAQAIKMKKFNQDGKLTDEVIQSIMEEEKFETEYGVSGMVKERKAQYKDLHTKHNIAGTCLCIAALIPLFIGAIINADSDLFLAIMLSLSFLIAGVGVICFIKTGIIWASYEKLLQEGEYSKENKERPSFSAAIYTAYWVIATAVYLGYSLSSNNWGQSWIIWVVAGVIFPAVIAITNAFEKKSK